MWKYYYYVIWFWVLGPIFFGEFRIDLKSAVTILYIFIWSHLSCRQVVQHVERAPREGSTLNDNFWISFPKMLHGFPAGMTVVVNLAPLADTSVNFRHQSGGHWNRPRTYLASAADEAVREKSRLGGLGALRVQRKVEFAKGTVKVDCRWPLVLFRRRNKGMWACWMRLDLGK